MNILFLSELFYPHGSDGELATYLYAKLLSQKGFNVKVVTNARAAGQYNRARDESLLGME